MADSDQQVGVESPSLRLRPNRWDVFGILVVGAVLLVAFWEIPFGGKTFSTAGNTVGVQGFDTFPGLPTRFDDPYRLDPGASAWQTEPWAEVVNEAYGEGRLPLWNPYQGSGAPLAANMISGAFDPLLLPVNLHPTPLVWDLTTLGAFLLGAVSMYAFGRVLGLGGLSATVSSVAFALSGTFFLYSNNPFVRSYCFFPVLFLLVELVIGSRRLLPVLGLGLATAANLLLGMPEISVVVIGMAGTYALVRVIMTRRTTSVALSAARTGGGFVLGFMMAAPLLMLLWEYVGQSVHVHTAQNAVGLRSDSTHAILNLIVPFFGGPPRPGLPGIGWTGTRDWIGAGVFVLALVGLSGRRLSRQFHAPVFGLFALLLVLKVYDFGILEWIGHLPVLAAVIFPAFGLPAVNFLMATMAGIGIEVLRQRDVVVWRFAVLMLLSVIAGALLFTSNQVLIEAAGVNASRQFALAAIVGLAIAALAVLPRGWGPAAWVAAVVVVLELFVLAPSGIYGDRKDPFGPNPLAEELDHLMDEEPEARIFGFDALMFPNVAGAFGLQDVRYLDALNVERYSHFVRTFFSPSVPPERFVGGPYASTEEAFGNYLDNQMFDLLGVRWLLTTNPKTSTGLGLDLANSLSFNQGLDFRFVRAAGDVRFAFFEHADGDVVLPPPPDDTVALVFDYAIDEAAFDSEGQDGVAFSVVGTYDDGTRRVLWEDEYLPGTDPVAPEWRSAVVDLGGGITELSEVHLVTAHRGNAIADWSAWSDLDYLARGEETAGPQFRFVGSAGVTSIYENTNAYPRAWVVHSILPVTGQDQALATLQSFGSPRPDGSVRVDELDLREVAVIEFGERPSPDVESVRKRLSDCAPAREDVVTIDEYDSNRVAITVETECPGFVLLSDTYYPGWEATVNGESAPLYPADLAIRAVEVGPGRSTVVLRYRPASFRVGLLIAGMAIVGFVAVAGTSRWRRQRLVGASSSRPANDGSLETIG